MKLNDLSELYIPGGLAPEKAVSRTTRLAIAAHQDDVEMMAPHGILECYDSDTEFFSAVVMTNGAGSPRADAYAFVTDAEMIRLRKAEQKEAADIGRYSALVLTNYPSAAVKKAGNQGVLEDLVEIIRAARPDIIYTHNPADKHLTHVAVAVRVIEALRALPVEYRPKKLYGCEIWRSLDWVSDGEKTVLDLSGHDGLRAKLIGVFRSQIHGGKRYDSAIMGRQRANATFLSPHATDGISSAAYAIDMTPMMEGGDIGAFITDFIRRFAQDVCKNISEVS